MKWKMLWSPEPSPKLENVERTYNGDDVEMGTKGIREDG